MTERRRILHRAPTVDERERLERDIVRWLADVAERRAKMAPERSTREGAA